jgi:hypothetical protein
MGGELRSGMVPAYRVAASLCLAGLAAAVLGCGPGASDDPLAPALKNAAAADSALGVRYRFRSRLQGKDRTFRARGYGQAEPDQRRTRTVVVVGKDRMETVTDGDIVYTGGGFVVQQLHAFGVSAPKARWTKLDGRRMLDAGYIDALCGSGLPPKLAGMLLDTDPRIEDLGSDRIDGARMHGYRVTTTYGRVLDALAGDEDASRCDKHDRAARFVAVLWIDRNSLVRRTRVRYRLADGSHVETSDIDYARDVRVAVPAGAVVHDVTGKLLELADSLCEKGC